MTPIRPPGWRRGDPLHGRQQGPAAGACGTVERGVAPLSSRDVTRALSPPVSKILLSSIFRDNFAAVSVSASRMTRATCATCRSTIPASSATGTTKMPGPPAFRLRPVIFRAPARSLLRPAISSCSRSCTGAFGFEEFIERCNDFVARCDAHIHIASLHGIANGRGGIIAHADNMAAARRPLRIRAMTPSSAFVECTAYPQ